MMGWFRVIGLSVCTALAGCGPATTLKNDTQATVYADFIKSGVPRPPHAQKLASGVSYTAPWLPADANALYVGSDPAKLQMFPVAKLCDLKEQSCEILASRLLGSGGNGN